MRLVKWILLIVFSILIAGVVIILTFNTEIRNYAFFQVAPDYAKKVTFVKVGKESQEIYLLGTIHGQHLTTKDYSLSHIGSVIKNLNPDLVLVESRPEELAKDNWGDGPLEMPFASLTAKSMGISVGGMDWSDKNVNPGTTNETRDDKMVTNILQSVKGYRKVLVLTGFSHVPEFTTRLQKEGYKEMAFSNTEKEKLFLTPNTKFLYPKGMSYYIEKKINVEKDELSKEKDPEWISAIKNVIESRQELLKNIKVIGEKK